MLKKLSLPLQLILVIGIVTIFGSFFNETFVSVSYTFSLLFKEILGLFLPLIVFSFILGGILSFKKNAPVVLLILLAAILLSNFIVATLAFFVGTSCMSLITGHLDTASITVNDIIKPLLSFKLPALISAETSMLSAIIIGLFFSYKRNAQVTLAAQRLKNTVERILNTFFIPLLPFYVFGFLSKLAYEGTFHILFKSYGSAFVLIISMQLLYLMTMYFGVSGFTIAQTLQNIRNAIPSYLTAFSTMSSTASIPVTLRCAENNGVNSSLAHLAVPIAANVHLLGDAITTPILSLVTMFIFLGSVPTIGTFLMFVLYFCMAMLATSGVPGGGIIVVIPLLKSIFGFTPEMVSIITTLYLLQDCLGTAGNVMGDGALTILVDKVLKKLGISTE